jgi:hypothetical protein
MALSSDDKSIATLTTGNTEVAKPNKNRHFFDFVNYGANPCWLKLGNLPTGIYLSAHGGSYEINLTNPWDEYIYAQAIGGNTSLSAIEVSKI